jgi:hypothetical protein
VLLLPRQKFIWEILDRPPPTRAFQWEYVFVWRVYIY